MTQYLVWFRASSAARTIVVATSRKEAIALFAAQHDCIPSGYIAARKA